MTLGVGVALATTPGIAYADPSDPPNTTNESDTGDDDTAEDTTIDTVDEDDLDEDDVEEEEEELDDEDLDDEDLEEEDLEEEDLENEDLDDQDLEDEDLDDDNTNNDGNQNDGDTNQDITNDDAEDETEFDDVSVDTSADAGELPPNKNDETASTQRLEVDTTSQLQTFSLPKSSPESLTQTANLFTTRTAAPLAQQQPSTLLSVATNLVVAVLTPLLGAGDESPLQLPILTAVLSLVRNEFERILAPSQAAPAAQQVTTAAVDPSKQRVLVIAVDGTNLSRILEDPDNDKFAALMADSTTAPSSIVGHTTVSNPSWTAIMTGVWGERTGVFNNVFTPWTYDSYPTVFNQLESQNPDIDTTVIANWDVINAIGAAGGDDIDADTNLFVQQYPDDTNWLETDNEVADLTIAAIEAADGPTFIYSYYVGIDENGHMYGGDSPEYEAAIENMDENLGRIMLEVNEWNAAHPDEQWTVIVVTDHGHQPQQGLGHGFQSPDETETFVIANGPDFAEGNINQEYEIVDVTPTVVDLFGIDPRAGSDGVSLLTLSGGDELPDNLKEALEAAIAENGYPDLITQVALGARTVFGFIPYYLFNFGNDTIADLPDFLVLPASVVFDGLYVITNVPAQVVAFLTGVSGARLFPLLPPEPPNFTPVNPTFAPDAAVIAV